MLRPASYSWDAKASPHHLERAPPPGLIEEVQNHASDEFQTIADFGLLILVRGCFEGPVNKHRPSNDILLRNESPESAVITYIPVVAHPEIAVRRNDNVVALYVLLHHQLPVNKQVVVFSWGNCREIISIGADVLRVAVDHVRLVEFLSIAVYDRIA